MMYDKALKFLRDYIQCTFKGNATKASRYLGISLPTLSRWINQDRTPNAKDFVNSLGLLGVKLVFPPINGEEYTDPEATSKPAESAADNQRLEAYEKLLEQQKNEIKKLNSDLLSAKDKIISLLEQERGHSAPSEKGVSSFIEESSFLSPYGRQGLPQESAGDYSSSSSDKE